MVEKDHTLRDVFLLTLGKESSKEKEHYETIWFRENWESCKFYFILKLVTRIKKKSSLEDGIVLKENSCDARNGEQVKKKIILLCVI